VSTFIECLELLADFRGLTLEVEVKNDARERLERVCSGVCRALRDGALHERVVVSSFETAALEIVQSLAPHLRRAFITATDPSGSIATATRLGCSQIDNGRTDHSQDDAREAHGRGLAVTGWLGNTVHELRYLVDCGVNAVMSDFPSLALRSD
jgi:glycerophosphoryl diester phosphodiesterase